MIVAINVYGRFKNKYQITVIKNSQLVVVYYRLSQSDAAQLLNHYNDLFDDYNWLSFRRGLEIREYFD